MVNDTAHDQVSEDHGHQGGQDADMGHTENRIECNTTVAPSKPPTNCHAGTPNTPPTCLTEKQHSDPKNQRTAKE